MTKGGRIARQSCDIAEKTAATSPDGEVRLWTPRSAEETMSKSSSELSQRTRSRVTPQLRAVSTAFPETWFTQQEVIDRFHITDPRVISLFLGGEIDGRALCLPDPGTDGFHEENQSELLAKHQRVGIELGAQAIREAVTQAGFVLDDLGYLCCVTSTGFMAPGLSAYLIKELDLPRSCGRLDVVGMGCNAGLNGLAPVTARSAQHPGEVAVLVCVEVCSAAYVLDDSMRSAIVNSLFGDGAAAAVVYNGDHELHDGPRIIDFSSLLITESIGAMRFDWDENKSKFSFYVDKETPYVVGANIEKAVSRLLQRSNLKMADIDHWVVHSGGKKVVDSITYNLGLSKHDLRHTRGVLRSHGNVSSASFLVSYKRLADEGVAQPGDYGIFVTMGPGSTIETALVTW